MKTLKLEQFEGKTLQDVRDYLEKVKVPVAGDKELDDVLKNPDKYPELKDEKYYFFFGGVFRNSGGLWDVPCVQWGGSSFRRGGDWLSGDWDGDDRVVSVETESCTLKSCRTCVLCVALEKLKEAIKEVEKNI